MSRARTAAAPRSGAADCERMGGQVARCPGTPRASYRTARKHSLAPPIAAVGVVEVATTPHTRAGRRSGSEEQLRRTPLTLAGK
eukprot:6182812-Pleurochrysis_carterae.AAC.1